MNAGRARAVRIVVNLVAFEGAWFACVIAAAHGAVGIGVAAVAASLALHFMLSRERSRDAWLLAATLVVGVVWENALARTGLVDYAAPAPALGAAPAWILALWALFASALREPLRWLHGRPAWAAAFGAGGGALSYLGAARLGACRFADTVAALLVLGLGWALVTPLLLELARRLEARPAPAAVACR